MTGGERSEAATLHEQHIALLRSIVTSQQELIDVLETITEQEQSDGVTYRDIAERQSERYDDYPP